MTHERRLFSLALAAGTPGSVTALALLWTGTYTPKVQWTLTVLIVGLWLGFANAVRERTIFPLQTIANLLEALREGDYSIRGRAARTDDCLGEVMVEINALGELLRSQRFHAVDAAALLAQVIEAIDVAVFTFDHQRRLRLVNRAGAALMVRPADRLLGQGAEALGLGDLLDGEPARTIDRGFAGIDGRWQCRCSSFREAGEPHQLLVLTDLSKALREEERQAWQRLIRVLAHELNNSLAPIKSTAQALASVLRRSTPLDEWRDDAERGLDLIANRCASLDRFVSAYSQLARLPPPQTRPTPVTRLVQRAVALEPRMNVTVAPGPPLEAEADPDQLEQLLINLVKNAVDATLERTAAEQESGQNGTVEVSWRRRQRAVEIRVRDEGPGVANPANLFVPFFTTKPGGTGIGLVLSRQIAEAHGGSLSLANRRDRRGADARLLVPLVAQPDQPDEPGQAVAPRPVASEA